MEDESILPVRGQISWLIPRPEVNYGVIYKNVLILGRRDGIVVQGFGALGEMEGYNDSNEAPDRVAAAAAVGVVAMRGSRVWAELGCARGKERRLRGELFGFQRSCGHKPTAILLEKQ